jgi:hypothetical protein
MLRNFAVALLAATVLTAPALAQNTNADTKTPAAATTPLSKTASKPDQKTVAAKPMQKSASAHKHHRHVAHVKHVKHVAHLKHVKHAKYVKAAPATDSAKHHVRHVTKKPASTTGSAAANAAKPKSGAN